MICTEITESARSLQSELTCPICLYMLTNSMGTLKTVCSSWFALISRDKYEHTHLRVPMTTKECLHRYSSGFLIKPQKIDEIF